MLRAVPFILALVCSLSHCDVGADTHMASERMHRIHGTGGRKKTTGKMGRPEVDPAESKSPRAAEQKARYQARKAGIPFTPDMVEAVKAVREKLNENDDVGKSGRATEGDGGIDVDRSPAADARRAEYRRDAKKLYDDFVASTVRDRKTGEKKKRTLGQFHHFFLDFLNLDLDDVVTYSPLSKWLPAKDEHGDFPERWLYFKTLDSDPIIQDGPTGELADQFYKKFWQGIMIRVCGDARTKCALTPRDHLKSTVGGVLQTLFRMVRDPSDRHVIRSGRSALAKQFLEGIKAPFMFHDEFRALWGDWVPTKRQAAWNTERIQLNIPRDERRGNDPTVQIGGKGTDLTGTHGDYYIPDDLVNAKNSTNENQLEATCELMSAMQANREPDSCFTDLGTRWHDDDAHGFFVGEPGKTKNSGSFAEYSCFFVATVLDGDETVPVAPLKNGFVISQLGYGKPIWPEGFNLRTIQQRRSGMPEDRLWNGQFFNQFIGTMDRFFHEDWIRDWPEEYERMSAIELATQLKLNIYMGVDTASGKEIQTKKLDPTAGLVLGQTPDRTKMFVLDGFREMLPAEQIPLAIVDLGMKWNKVARDNGTVFQCGVEATVYTEFLHIVIENEIKKLGPAAFFPIDPMDHKNAVKADRIRTLVPAYRNGEYFWPKSLVVSPTRQPERPMARKAAERDPYDLRPLLRSEFVGYHPNATHDGLLDCMVYASRLALPSSWKAEPEKPEVLKQRGQYSRGDVPERMEMVVTDSEDGERTMF